VSDTVSLLDEQKKQWVAALDEAGCFEGWIEREDLESAETLAEALTPAVTTASPRTPLNEALSMMLASASGSVAVLDDDMHLVGILSFGAIRNVLATDEEDDE
jgi:CBS domain-containing protein